MRAEVFGQGQFFVPNQFVGAIQRSFYDQIAVVIDVVAAGNALVQFQIAQRFGVVAVHQHKAHFAQVFLIFDHQFQAVEQSHLRYLFYDRAVESHRRGKIVDNGGNIFAEYRL